MDGCTRCSLQTGRLVQVHTLCIDISHHQNRVTRCHTPRSVYAALDSVTHENKRLSAKSFGHQSTLNISHATAQIRFARNNVKVYDSFQICSSKPGQVKSVHLGRIVRCGFKSELDSIVRQGIPTQVDHTTVADTNSDFVTFNSVVCENMRGGVHCINIKRHLRIPDRVVIPESRPTSISSRAGNPEANADIHILNRIVFKHQVISRCTDAAVYKNTNRIRNR